MHRRLKSEKTQRHLAPAPVGRRGKVRALAAPLISRVTPNYRTSSLISPFQRARTQLGGGWNATSVLTRFQMKRRLQSSMGKSLPSSWDCEISEWRLFFFFFFCSAQNTAVSSHPITNIVINHISFSCDRMWLGEWWMKSLADRFHCRGGRVSLVRLAVNVQSFRLCVPSNLLQQRWKI